MSEEIKKDTVKKGDVELKDIKEKSVIEKLFLAKNLFHKEKIQKTGKNPIGYSYFSLDDIIPVSLKVLKEARLFSQTSFVPRNSTEAEYAKMVIYNVDNFEEKIVYTIPTKEIAPTLNREGKEISNSAQLMGSVVTYFRRYLFMLLFDIIERDGFDSGDLEGTKPIPKVPTVNLPTSNPIQKNDKPVENTQTSTSTISSFRIPLNVDQRAEVQKETLDVNGQANDFELERLQALAQELQLTNNDDLKTMAGQIAAFSKMFTDITRKNCEKAIIKMTNKLNEYKVNGLK
ncbi:MAG: ERF family protein [Bacilli bacterium]